MLPTDKVNRPTKRFAHGVLDASSPSVIVFAAVPAVFCTQPRPLAKGQQTVRVQSMKNRLRAGKQVQSRFVLKPAKATMTDSARWTATYIVEIAFPKINQSSGSNNAMQRWEDGGHPSAQP